MQRKRNSDRGQRSGENPLRKMRIGQMVLDFPGFRFCLLCVCAVVFSSCSTVQRFKDVISDPRVATAPQKEPVQTSGKTYFHYLILIFGALLLSSCTVKLIKDPSAGYLNFSGNVGGVHLVDHPDGRIEYTDNLSGFNEVNKSVRAIRIVDGLENFGVQALRNRAATKAAEATAAREAARGVAQVNVINAEAAATVTESAVLNP
jgi:hypothetical protein